MIESYFPAYTKEDAESFGKLINRCIKKIKYSELLESWRKKAPQIEKLLDNHDYYRYILSLCDLLDEVELQYLPGTIEGKFNHFLHIPFEDMPLYINGDAIINKIAKWRLHVGK